MAFIIAAPYPGVQTTTVLPNPQFGNSEALTGTLDIKRSITGKRRTYVKNRNGRRKLGWTFTLTRNKALELLEFYRSYHAQGVFIEDHESRKWVGFITNNPFEIEMSRRGIPTRQDWPVGESCTVTMEFEGFRTTDTTIEDSLPFLRVFGADASSGLSMIQQFDAYENLPNISGLQNNWDAKQITGVQNGSKFNVWYDSGAANNDLIARTGTLFNPMLDRSPVYHSSNPVLNGFPAVDFEPDNTASMITTSNMSIFPNKYGTIFWVMSLVGGNAYTNYANATKQQYNEASARQQLEEATTPLCDDSTQGSVEAGCWALSDSSGNIEQIDMAGASSPVTPINLRFEPENPPFNDSRLATSNKGAICKLDANIFMVQRAGTPSIRLRTNGIERSGAILNTNRPSTFGKFSVNDRAWIVQDARIHGAWGQILVYNRALTDIEIAQVESYLSLRWGIKLGEVEF